MLVTLCLLRWESTPRTWGELRGVVGVVVVIWNQPHARGENTNKVLYIKGPLTPDSTFLFIFATLHVDQTARLLPIIILPHARLFA